MGPGQITGRVIGPDGTTLSSVIVTTTYQGKTYQATTANKTGVFSLSIPDVERGTGFNLQFSRANFNNASAAAVISLPNLKTDIGDVTMTIVGGDDGVSMRWITGQIIDNFSYKPLVGANVLTVDSAGQGVIAVTDDAGKFELGSMYFALGSSFAVTATKTNYITRTDLVSVITAEENPIKNSPIRLYQKFGAIYGYLKDDSTGNPLNGATATLTSSNNQQISCTSGGPYNSEPLAIGQYCPDMDDNYGTLDNGGKNPSAYDNTPWGGFKIKDQFLLLGNRYTITLSKTSALCTARSTTATNCYRTKTTFADVQLTGNNSISSGTVTLNYDSWIYGSVTGGAGAGVTVKLYNSANTYIAQTTTDAAGNFILDNPSIARTVSYKLTFEKAGYYSRLIGVPNGVQPCAPFGVTYQSEIIVPPISIAGPTNAGAIPMTVLCPPTHCVKGTVNDYWSTLPVSGAQVLIFDGGWRSATTDGLGQYNIGGNFGNPASRNGDLTLGSTTVTNTSTAGLIVGTLVSGVGIAPGTTITGFVSGTSFTMNNAASTTSTQSLSFMPFYPVQISKTNYTGESQVAMQTFSFAHNGIAACPGSPYDLDIQASACNATGAGPSGGTNCVAQQVLHPIGIYSSVGNFASQIKQTYEKFLTEKNGLTISARSAALPLVQNPSVLTEQTKSFFLHFDDTPKPLPGVPEGKWSNHVPVNPTSSSPTVNGVLTEGFGNDSRITPWELKTYVYYHFYAAKMGQYTIETTGSTDTYITLYAQTGANFGSDDDSGSGSNAKLTNVNLGQGWYYIKVSNKGNNVFGFFDVQVTATVSPTDTDYSAMISPITGGSPSYQTVNGSGNYSTNCAPGNGNLILSWYNALAGNHMMYIAAPGENGGCSATATIEKHGAIGEIIRGKFSGTLRPISPTGINQSVTNGYFNIIRTE